APRWGLLDQPGERKVHRTPTPLGGGIGIWLGVVLPVAVAHVLLWFVVQQGKADEWLPAEFRVDWDAVLSRSLRLWAILLGGTILAGMGLLDDFRNLSWKLRLFIQVCVAVGIVAAGVQATIFLAVPFFGAAVTVLWILVLVNAFNFLDNMDGLSGGIGLIAALLFAVVMLSMTSEPRWLVGGLLLVLAGSIAGFLFLHNWPPAKIFMGDSGSYFIGLMLACLSVVGTFYDDQSGGKHVLLAPLCILAIPLYDFTSVMLIRLLQGRSPFQPDKSHFSHRLVELGLQPRNAVLTIHLATLTTGIGALLLYSVPHWPAALLVVTMIGCVLAIIAILETVGRRSANDQ
ncbi:MAG: undecaprenyl/decaprenyl-phosphate alpha-N-acetylglucosaminyl 1-phosphate transferase, partial [Planctomycetes bacterium]|nr:undecaprenyl/decaprenyl-phosphate alpha-N-acetylglucosaminyl 1-phosphate transferase [Planctomycetota bacterium]